MTDEKRKVKNRVILLGGITFLIILTSSITFAYSVESGAEVHQYIAKEAREVWNLIPYEVKNHTGNPINTDIEDVDVFGDSDYDESEGGML